MLAQMAAWSAFFWPGCGSGRTDEPADRRGALLEGKERRHEVLRLDRHPLERAR